MLGGRASWEGLEAGGLRSGVSGERASTVCVLRKLSTNPRTLDNTAVEGGVACGVGSSWGSAGFRGRIAWGPVRGCERALLGLGEGSGAYGARECLEVPGWRSREPWGLAGGGGVGGGRRAGLWGKGGKGSGGGGSAQGAKLVGSGKLGAKLVGSGKLGYEPLARTPPVHVRSSCGLVVRATSLEVRRRLRFRVRKEVPRPRLDPVVNNCFHVAHASAPGHSDQPKAQPDVPAIRTSSLHHPRKLVPSDELGE